MFGENGLRNNGAHTAGPNDSHQCGDGMDKEDDEFAHPLSYQFPNPNTFNVLGISPGTTINVSSSVFPEAYLGRQRNRNGYADIDAAGYP